jgi:hypothetical protein
MHPAPLIMISGKPISQTAASSNTETTGCAYYNYFFPALIED